MRIPLFLMATLGAAILTACDNAPTDNTEGDNDGAPTAHAHDAPDAKCYLCDAAIREPGRLWCREHGRYEDRCWICQPQLRDKSRLYCKEHFLYEDECHLCRPELLKEVPQPAPDSKSGASRDNQDQSPQIQATSAPALFCNEHRVFERECGICQPQLASTLEPGQSMKVRFASPMSASKAGVRTATPRQSQSAPEIMAFCRIGYNENKLAHITPRTPGIVSSVVVDVGSDVKAGDVLAVLESSVLAEARSDYLARLHAVQLAKIDVDRSRVIQENTAKALEVLQSEPSVDDLNRLSELDLGMNRKRLLGAYASFVAARAAYEREKRLQAEHISSKADYQAAEARYQAAWADHLATKDDVAFGSKRDMESKSREVKTATFSMESAGRRLCTLGLSEGEIDAISVASAGLSRHKIRAPFDGTIVARKAVVGEAIAEGHPLVTLVDLSQMWLSLSIPSDHVALISKGSQVEVDIPDLHGTKIAGTLVWVDTAIDERSRMVKARAVVENPNGRLKSGMFGEARIAVGAARHVLRVPKDAVLSYGRHPYVFIRREDDLYDIRRVALGRQYDGAVDIVSGLNPQEQIVVAGTFTVMSEFLKSRLGAGCVDD